MTYLLTSDKFEGSVLFEFDKDGYLIRYDITGARLNEDQKVFILKKLPRSIGGIKDVIGQSKGSKLTEQKSSNVTFEMFWDHYDEKARSSKKKCQNWWNRSTQLQRDRAYNFVENYKRSIPPGIAKKYAESYLNAELWNN